MKVVYRQENYRIIEVPDYYIDMEDLKVDCFCPNVNSEVDQKELLAQEEAFELYVEEHGVFGYVLERWNPEVDRGWECEDSCYGFIGPYEIEKHYIVEEFKTNIKEA